MKKIFLLGLFCLFFGYTSSVFAAVPILNLEAKESAGSITVTWDAVPEAAYYKVFNPVDLTLYTGGSVGKTTTFILTNVKPDTTYKFAVRAYKAGASDYFAGSDTEIRTAASIKTDPKAEVGAPFPGEPKKVDLIDHIMYAHKWATIIGTIIAAFMIIWAGFKYAISAGNPEALQDAKDTLIGAIIGLAIIVLTYVLLQVLGVRVVGQTP